MDQLVEEGRRTHQPLRWASSLRLFAVCVCSFTGAHIMVRACNEGGLSTGQGVDTTAGCHPPATIHPPLAPLHRQPGAPVRNQPQHAVPLAHEGVRSGQQLLEEDQRIVLPGRSLCYRRGSCSGGCANRVAVQHLPSRAGPHSPALGHSP